MTTTPDRRRWRHLLTRVELSRSLPASFSQVDRLIAGGLKAAAQRGRAKLYRLSDARRLVQRDKRETESTNLVLLADAKARRVRATFLRLQAQYTTGREEASCWSWLVARVRRSTTEMVDALTRRLSAPIATSPPPEPPRDRRFLDPAALHAIVAGDPLTYPWKAPATPAIRALVARGIGIELRHDGAWLAWHPDPDVPAHKMCPLTTPTMGAVIKTAVNDLLTSLAATAPPVRKPARPLPSVKRSASLRAARSQAAYFQVRLVELRDAIANHAVILRDDVIREQSSRALACRARLLALPHVARRAGTDPARMRAALTRAIHEALEELGRAHHTRKEEIA